MCSGEQAVTEDMLDGLKLREITGATATLRSTATGFVYQDGGRQYRLTRRGPRSSTMATIEAWAFGTYHVVTGDVSLSWCRHELAAALARGDAALESLARTDLRRFAWAVRFSVIEVEIMAGLEDEPGATEPPRRSGLFLSGRSRGARKRKRRRTAR